MLVSVEEKSAVDKAKMGKRIKVVRKKSGLTQEAFGDRISGRILQRGFGSAYFFIILAAPMPILTISV